MRGQAKPAGVGEAAFYDREPPLWLTDPFQKHATPIHVVVHSCMFIATWYLCQGYRFPAVPLALALACFTVFMGICFRLRMSVRSKFGVKDNAFIHSYYGVEEAWLNLYPLVCGVLVAAFDHFSEASVLPADPLRKFAGLWVCVFSATHFLNSGSHAQFYAWFRDSGMKIAERRGWGARGYSLYGGWIPFLKSQSDIPRLSTHAFNWSNILQPWNFYCSWLPLSPVPPAAHFLAGFFSVLLRHSQLFAENNAGMHKPVLLPAVCWYLAFAPQLWCCDGGTGAGLAGPLGLEGPPAWPTAFLKLHIVSIYFMAGLGKTLTAWMQGKWSWADGTNMQYFCFVAMWARPGAGRGALPRLSWLVQRRWACMLLGFGGLVFEIGSPVALLGGCWSVLFFAASVKFHYGVFLLQGIDFTGHWVPCLLVFLLDRRPVTTMQAVLPSEGLSAPWLEIGCWALAAAHLLGQLYCSFTLREVRKDGDQGGMPFSCLHMFTVSSNIFGNDFCSWYTMMSGDQRASGHLGIMEWSGPIFTDFHMSEEDMALLPFKVVWFGHTMCQHRFLDGIVRPEYQQKRFLVFANFEMSRELKGALQDVCRMVEPHTDAGLIRDPAALRTLLVLQGRAQEAFDRDVVSSSKAVLGRVLKRTASFLEKEEEEDLDKMPTEVLLKLERTFSNETRNEGN